MSLLSQELNALSDLLGTSKEAEDYEAQNSSAIVTPASFGQPAPSDNNTNQPIGQILPEDPKAIWTDEEVPWEEDIEDFDDPRGRPEHEILYKQDVMTEDVFLGLGGKDPSTSNCDTMVVKVVFPGHKMEDLDLDVTKNKLRAESASLKLALYLPNPVLHKDGKAKWDAQKDTLIVTLPIEKEEW